MGLRSKSRTRRYLNKVGGADESSTRYLRERDIIRDIFFNDRSMGYILRDDELEEIKKNNPNLDVNDLKTDNPQKLVVLTLKNKYGIEKQDFINIVEENGWNGAHEKAEKIFKDIQTTYDDDCSDGMCSIM